MESKSINLHKGEIFKFNLIPPKSIEEIVVIEKRDNSILNSFLFIFLGVFIFFILNVIQTFVINERLNQDKSIQLEQEKTISTFDQVRIINGELITKSNILEPVLLKDIKITQLLEVSEKILNLVPGILITTYSRESTGEFVLNIEIENIQKVIDLIKKIQELEEIENIFVRSMNLNQQSNNLNILISFNLSAI